MTQNNNLSVQILKYDFNPFQFKLFGYGSHFHLYDLESEFHLSEKIRDNV